MNLRKNIFSLLMIVAAIVLLASCVDQHPEKEAGSDENKETRIIATSNATLHICDRLGLDLIAIPKTQGEIPERYKGLPEVGTAMAPDAEAIAMLEPTDIIGPDTLRDTIEPTYKAANVPYTFIDLQSVEGMYESIKMIGEKYGLSDKADEMIGEYEKTMADFKKRVEGKEPPKVLVLMGLPGTYIECTPNSYVGSLIELAGAKSVVQDDFMNFVSWNTEELLKLDPDVILLTAHGLPDLAMEMFEKEFSTNDIWKHFRAVKENKVYSLDYDIFGMSCTFAWPKALESLEEILYEGTYESFDTTGKESSVK